MKATKVETWERLAREREGEHLVTKDTEGLSNERGVDGPKLNTFESHTLHSRGDAVRTD